MFKFRLVHTKTQIVVSINIKKKLVINLFLRAFMILPIIKRWSGQFIKFVIKNIGIHAAWIPGQSKTSNCYVLNRKIIFDL